MSVLDFRYIKEEREVENMLNVRELVVTEYIDTSVMPF